MNLFNAVFSAFNGIVSRSFWLGNFAPVLLAAALHALFLSLVFPDRFSVGPWMSAGLASQAGSLTVVLLGLVVLAYSLSPITPLLRGILDGQFLPVWASELLRRARYQIAVRKKAEQERVALESVRLGRLRDALAKEVWPAGQAQASPVDTDALQNACERQLRHLEGATSTGKVPKLKEVSDVYDQLKELCAAQPAPPDLDAMGRRLQSVLADAVELGDAATKQLRDRDRFPLRAAHTQPTQVGDARRLTERYSEVMYGAPFNYIWPRLQLLLQDGTDKSPGLDAAQAQLDFAVLSLTLTATVPLVWLPILAVVGGHVALIIALGVAAPLSWRFFYQLVVESQAAYGSLVRALIDRHHLDVLVAMGLGRPTTTRDERDLWLALQTGDQGDQGKPRSLRFEPAAQGATR